MFEKITDVPLEIRDFYQEITEQREKLDEYGNIVTESVVVPGFDMEGNPIELTTNKPVMEDYTYVQLITKTETKTFGDVWRVAEIHKGNNDSLIKRFLGMLDNGIQWEFHDDYMVWYLERELLVHQLAEIPETLPIPDSEPEEVVEDPSRALRERLELLDSQKPIRPARINIEQWFLDNYYRLREVAYPPKEKQLEMQFDDQVNGTTLWLDSLIKVRKQYPKPA